MVEPALGSICYPLTLSAYVDTTLIFSVDRVILALMGLVVTNKSLHRLRNAFRSITQNIYRKVEIYIALKMILCCIRCWRSYINIKLNVPDEGSYMCSVSLGGCSLEQGTCSPLFVHALSILTVRMAKY